MIRPRAIDLLRCCLVAVLLSGCGCNYERDRSYEMGASDTPLPPLTREYILASQRGFYYLSTATSVKTATDRPRGNQTLHSETEIQCPDRYRLRLTGALEMERIVIGNTQYERHDRGDWKISTLAGNTPYFARCKSDERAKRNPPDEAQAELYAGAYQDLKVAKGPVREYHGVKCQEYTVSMEGSSPMTSCFSLQGEPYRVQYSRSGFTSVDYDRNIPIDIRPPKLTTQTSAVR